MGKKGNAYRYKNLKRKCELEDTVIDGIILLK
jgi:hypothetical protein